MTFRLTHGVDVFCIPKRRDPWGLGLKNQTNTGSGHDIDVGKDGLILRVH